MPEYQGRLWALSFFLEKHVWATGCLPVGRLHVDWPELKEVDCDALFGIQETGSSNPTASSKAPEAENSESQ
jgi:hypothetical protein